MEKEGLSEVEMVNRRKAMDDEFADRDAEKLHLLYPFTQACLGGTEHGASCGGALASDNMCHGEERSSNEVGLR